MEIDKTLKGRATDEDLAFLRHKSVVLVDDNIELRGLNAQLLKTRYEVYQFGNEGDLARFLHYGGRAHLYVLDGEVPRKRGGSPELLVEQMVSRIREAHRTEQSQEYQHPGILVMSGQAVDGLAKKLGVGIVPKGAATISRAVSDYLAAQARK